MSMRPQIPITTAESDDGLSFIRQMGIEHISLMLKPEELTDEAVAAAQERLAQYHITVSDALCQPL